MAHNIIELECPGCGAPISISTKQCPYCFRDIVIKTFNSVESMTNLDINKYANSYRKALADHPDDTDLNRSIAFCYLKLRLYDKALPYFEKAIENNFDDSETYFYSAICLLKGKKAFVAPRAVIDQIEEYLNAAVMIEPKGIYYYFQAYIKYDYFERKYLNTTPSYGELLNRAHEIGVSEHDVETFYQLLNVPKENW